MAYSKKEIEETFTSIIQEIEQGNALRTVLKNKDYPSSRTFFKWLDGDETKVKRYARACEKRADVIFEDMLDIADDKSKDVITLEDGREVFNSEFAARSRIRLDARKWILSKMQPKKYGDKLDITTGGEKIIKGINLD